VLDATNVDLRPGMSVIPSIATLSHPAEQAPQAKATPKLAVASFK